MGCGSSKTSEIPKPKGGKHFYPECSYTYETDKEITSLAPIDSSQLLYGTKGEIVILDNNKKKPTVFSSEHKGRVNSLKKLSSGHYVSAGQDKVIKIWDLGKTESLATLTGHTSMIWSITEISNGNLVSGADDKKLIIWDVEGQKIDTVLDEEKSEVSSVYLMRDGKLLSGYGSGKIKVWDIENKKIINEFNCGFGVWYFLELNDGKVAVGIGNGEIQIWDIENGNSIKKLTGVPVMAQQSANLTGIHEDVG